MNNNRVITLEKRPIGLPKLSDFKMITEAIPDPGQNEVLLKAVYISVDPYLRGKMNDAKSYTPPFELHKPISSAVISEVVKSNNNDFVIGDMVSGYIDWKEYQVSNGSGLLKVNKDAAPLSAYLGVIGNTGITAYLGLTQIGKPKKGETLVVSGAAGAVGSVVGQIGKLLGCRVVGIAGTDEKVDLLKNKFGFDEAINYKTTPDLQQAVAQACPNGVDIYFDNVGGSVSDAVMLNLNPFARVPLCGSISAYNDTESQKSMALHSLIVQRSILVQGFIVTQFTSQFKEAAQQLTVWLQEGKLVYTETIKEGFENIPEAFIGLFSGMNEGKMVVKV
jgi:NADPH-dependent curcumin reductase CurA